MSKNPSLRAWYKAFCERNPWAKAKKWKRPKAKVKKVDTPDPLLCSRCKKHPVSKGTGLVHRAAQHKGLCLQCYRKAVYGV